jgi:restriction system protein
LLKAFGNQTEKLRRPLSVLDSTPISRITGDKSPFEKVGPQIFTLRDSAVIPNDGNGTTPEVKKPPTPPSANAGFSFTDCAQKVLEEFGGKKPMHYKEITEKALEKGWLVTGGKTPEATMYAQVITEIKRQQKRGERPRFVQHGRGYVGLSQWMGRGLAFQIEQHKPPGSEGAA